MFQQISGSTVKRERRAGRGTKNATLGTRLGLKVDAQYDRKAENHDMRNRLPHLTGCFVAAAGMAWLASDRPAAQAPARAAKA